MKKRVGFVLLAALAVMVTMVAGCGTPNVQVKIPADRTVVHAEALVNNLYITLQNIHVHDTDGADVMIVNSSDVDLVPLWSGQDVIVASNKLAVGTYHDLRMSFTRVRGNGDIGDLNWDFDTAIDPPVEAAFPNVTIEVRPDNTAVITWSFDASLLVNYGGGSISTGTAQ